MTPEATAEALARDGYALLPHAAETARWAEAARAAARPVVESPAARAAWLRCAGTWFAGVDVLPNAEDGGVAGVPLAGPATAALDRLGLRPARWHAGQVSVVYPGYPQPREGESAAAARYRLTRDAAHVDGLLPVGRARRRMLREPHAFILGLPLTDNPPQAAPLVVWERSHRLIGVALREAARAGEAAGIALHETDLTGAYQTARRAAFETCRRVELPARPGEALLLHRHMLHGIAPWRAPKDPGGRMVAYFRPELADPAAWLEAD
jgi:hypothetical protein